MLLKRIDFMLANPEVIKRALRMLLPICFKYFQLMFLHCWIPVFTLSFVTPLVAMKFDMPVDVLDESFFVSTLVGNSVVAKRVCRHCPISFPKTVTLVDLVELDILDFDVIFGMYGYMLVLLPLIVELG